MAGQASGYPDSMGRYRSPAAALLENTAPGQVAANAATPGLRRMLRAIRSAHDGEVWIVKPSEAREMLIRALKEGSDGATKSLGPELDAYTDAARYCLGCLEDSRYINEISRCPKSERSDNCFYKFGTRH